MVSLFTLNCLESLNVERCFGGCTSKKKRPSKRKDDSGDSSSSSSSDDDDDKSKSNARPATSRRRFSSVPQALAERPLTDQLPKPNTQHFVNLSRASPAYYGMSVKPRSRQDNSQVISIRRKRYVSHSNETTPTNTPSASIKHVRVRPRSWDPDTWIAKAPRQPIDFSLASGEYSVCVVNMSKVVAHVSGEGFVGMMRHIESEPQGQTLAQLFTTRFADLMNMLFDTSVSKAAPSVICIVCENIPRNIISYPIVAKGKMEGLVFLWHDSLPQQEIAEMIQSA